ncbi:hypothetical protein BD779DRAFT_1487241 [Infundibulicybe gibba]|nr:hypothetical protein BD779DRAFT_1487241 [Infundibulicybe gibba]
MFLMDHHCYCHLIDIFSHSNISFKPHVYVYDARYLCGFPDLPALLIYSHSPPPLDLPSFVRMSSMGPCCLIPPCSTQFAGSTAPIHLYG